MTREKEYIHWMSMGKIKIQPFTKKRYIGLKNEGVVYILEKSRTIEAIIYMIETDEKFELDMGKEE